MNHWGLASDMLIKAKMLLLDDSKRTVLINKPFLIPEGTEV